MKSCPDRRCDAPVLTCRLGEDTPQECAVWNKGAGKAKSADSAGTSTGSRVPWSSAALGTAALAFFAGRAGARLTGVIGPHNAGKTTLLGLFYQQIGRSGRIGDALFAGSYSLEGWEAIAHALRWEGAAPRFPPHTSSGGGRVPGMLHLAVRDPQLRLADYLFADSPGEWFQRWAIDPAAADAEGARWLIERVVTLLVVADCDALAGPDRGSARNELVQLLRRVATERRGRPVALVWTKADVAVPPLIRAAIVDAARLVMSDIIEFETSVVAIEREGATITPVDAVARVLDWLVRPAPRGFELAAQPTQSRDPFFAVGVAA